MSKPIDSPQFESPICSVITCPNNWMEGAAIEQLKQTSALEDMRQVVGLPDLHAGKNAPVGAAYLTQSLIYPHLVGNDIGCGMTLWQSDLLKRRKKPERWLKKLAGFEEYWSGNTEHWLQKWGLNHSQFDVTLGTIGGGNHFAELQEIAAVNNETVLQTAGLSQERLFLLVHSGSRGRGEHILREYIQNVGTGGLTATSKDGRHYLAEHDQAVQWARANRALIAERFLDCIGATAKDPILDLCHNSVSSINGQWLHRKGAAPADQGLVMIPGSRGSLSYLVQPLPHRKSLWSLAHGAGRKWTRSDSKQRLHKRYRPNDLLKTRLGSWVICQNRQLLYEEAPEAYKSVDQVVKSLLDAELIDVIAEFKPVITYKTRKTL